MYTLTKMAISFQLENLIGSQFVLIGMSRFEFGLVFLSFQLEKFCCPIGVSVGNQLGCLESTGYAVKMIFQLEFVGKYSNLI